MGIAIILKDSDFSSFNLGKVELEKKVDVLRSIAILAEGSYSGSTAQLHCAFEPLNTTYNSVKWSIVEGGDYASIDTDSGLLVIKTGASNNNVKVRATSVHSSSIIAEKTISVTRVVNKVYSYEDAPIQPVFIDKSYFEKDFTVFIKTIGKSDNKYSAAQFFGLYIDDLAYHGIEFSADVSNNSNNRLSKDTWGEKKVVSTIGNNAPIGLKAVERNLYYTLDGREWTLFSSEYGTKKYPVAKVCRLKTYHEVIVHVDVYDGEKDLSDLFT
nr:MAG TPA: hypothetical protein [Caudoviricetes sp.]